MELKGLELKTLCADWLNAKAEEKAATKRRVDLETEILKITGSRDEGSKTTTIEGFKITTKGVINRKMDWEKWQLVRGNIPQTMWPVKTKMEIDEQGVKYLQANEPEYYRLLPLTATPGKTGVTIEPITEE